MKTVPFPKEDLALKTELDSHFQGWIQFILTLKLLA